MSRGDLAPRRFQGDGLTLVGDVGGDLHGIPVLLLHGGGQTRHSWGTAARALTARGYYVVALDARGHGDSDWSRHRDYSMTAHSRDVLAVVEQMPSLPVLVGASLGGIASLLAIGESPRPVARALVLVDITPRIDLSGAQRIADFMLARPQGYESVEEIADAVAAYLPDRPRPASTEGLRKNVRKIGDRYFWHWDPAVMADNHDIDDPAYWERLDTAARALSVPTLLVRGLRSEIVNDESVTHAKAAIRQLEIADISGAAHMVAGDRNDAFNAAIFAFLERQGEARLPE